MIEDGAEQDAPVLITPEAAANDPALRLPPTTDPPGPQNPPKQLTWLIFGATGHMGRALVRAALTHHDRVCAVGHSQSIDTPESMRKIHTSSASTAAAAESQRRNYLPFLCDVRVRDTVSSVFQTALEHFGRIDIVANCASHGIIGACEDQSEADMRYQFETNFMGTLNIIQLTLPYFRGQQQHHHHRGGRYVIFSSISGALGVPGLGPYCATKYAIEGLIESMLYEVDGFNIRATLVIGGHMRKHQEPSHHSNNHHPNPTPNDTPTPSLYSRGFHTTPTSAPYASPTAPAAHMERILTWIGNQHPTSAAKSGELIWQLGHCSFPPLRLPLGGYAVECVRDRLRSIIEEIEDWKHLNFAAVEVETEMDSLGEGKEGGNGEGGEEGKEEKEGEGDEEMDGDG